MQPHPNFVGRQCYQRLYERWYLLVVCVSKIQHNEHVNCTICFLFISQLFNHFLVCTHVEYKQNLPW